MMTIDDLKAARAKTAAWLETATNDEERARFSRMLIGADGQLNAAILKNNIKREKAFKKRIESIYGDVDAWWDWAKSLYPTHIKDGKIVVESYAHEGFKDKFRGAYDYDIEAKERIEELIKIKIRDRNRGHGHVDADLEKWAKKQLNQLT